MKQGKNEAQTYEEMTADMTESRDKGISVKRGNSIYKAQSGEYQEDKLRELVSASTSELVNAATHEKVALSDVQEVKERAVIYLRACEETGTFPTMLGLSRALGYSNRALNFWIKEKQETPTAHFLEMFSDTCADVLTQSALKNNANAVVSIFLSKAMYGMRETNELILTPNDKPIQEDQYSADEIKKRYM